MSRLTIDIKLPLDRFDLVVDVVLESPATCIFGPSGSGKTSLLETLAGLRGGARGVLRFNDETWLDTEHGHHLPPQRRGIGWTAQEGLLFPHLDVRRNLLAGAPRARRGGREPEDLLAEVVELLELENLLQRDITTLSGGERQRVALGRALCSGPRLLLLDEPFAALDLPLRRRLLPFLRRIREKLTVPMLLISHDPVEAQALCDDLLVLDQGSVIARGTPHDVLTDPKIFTMAASAGFENVLRGDLDKSSRRVILAPGIELVTEEASGHGEVLTGNVLSGNVLVGLRANDILIATEKPQGISARNLLPAEVIDVRPDEGLVRVTLAPNLPSILVQVTASTPRDLGISRGSQVFLVIKATACRVYGQS